MTRNKEVYQEAYQRALEGRSRSPWSFLIWQFEDDYSRRSRLEGTRDGAAARLASEAAATTTASGA
jgi:hypothetical protein